MNKTPASALPKKRIRLSDIADRVGVSRSAVANVLLKSAGQNVRVSAGTAERIRKAARELEYLPNKTAQRLAGKKSRIIGVLIDSYAPAPRFRQLAEVERAADAHGYRVMIGQSHGELRKIRSYVNDFLANDVAGVICISHDYPDTGNHIAETLRRIPRTVFLGKPNIITTASNWVSIDHNRATVDLVKHLLATGRRNPMLCLTDIAYNSSKDRCNGFIQTLADQTTRHPAERIHLFDQPGWDWGKTTLQPKLKKIVAALLDRHQPDAILASNDLVAVQILHALETLGVAVPDAIAVAGYDNADIANLVRPSLTSVDPRSSELATTGFDLLLRLIATPPADDFQHQITIPAKLVIRDSTAPSNRRQRMTKDSP